MPTQLEACYHSTLHLLDKNNLPQTPLNYWSGKQVVEAPSTRHTLHNRRQFFCRIDAHQQRSKHHSSAAVTKTGGVPVDPVKILRGSLGEAASLHNLVLELGGDGSLGGEVVEVLRDQLKVLLMAYSTR